MRNHAIILLCLGLCLSLLYAPPAHAFNVGAYEVTITGPTVVCPNQQYTYTAKAKLGGVDVSGLFYWSCIENGTNLTSFSTGTTQSMSTFTHTFGIVTGPATVTVSFKQSPAGVTLATDTDNITIRLFKPGNPYTDAPNNGVVFCAPGQTRTVSIPGVPLPSNTPEHCYYHYKYRWEAPVGWFIAIDEGSSDVRLDFNIVVSFATSLQITAPTNAPNGTNGKIKVTALHIYGETYSESDIFVGVPNIHTLSPVYKSPLNIITINSNVATAQNITSYEWCINNSSFSGESSTYNIVNPTPNYIYNVRMRARNPCGTSAESTCKIFYLNNMGQLIYPIGYSCGSGCWGNNGGCPPICALVSPNPSSTEINIEVSDSTTLYHNTAGRGVAVTNDLPENYHIILYNYQGLEVIHAEDNQTKLKLNVVDLAEGIYYLEIIYKEAVIRRRVVIRR